VVASFAVGIVISAFLAKQQGEKLVIRVSIFNSIIWLIAVDAGRILQKAKSVLVCV